MRKSIYITMVNFTFDLLSDEYKETIISAITGNPSSWDIEKYTKEMQQLIRDKMVELKHVYSFEEMNNETTM